MQLLASSPCPPACLEQQIDWIEDFLDNGANPSDEEEADLETPILRSLVWLGNARRNIQMFPSEARKLIGDQLQLIQFGGMPKDAKPFKNIGGGVVEIALRHDTDAYRVVIALRIGRKIYVLHAFQKKSKKGVATPKQDIDLIKRRYAEAKELAKDEG